MDLTHLKAAVPEGAGGEAELERFQDASERAFLQGWFLGRGGGGVAVPSCPEWGL